MLYYGNISILWHMRFAYAALYTPKGGIMKTKTDKLKTAVGVILILIAVIALLFWEAEGREMLLMETVLVADSDVKEGERLGPERLRAISVPAGTLVDGALSPDDIDLLRDKEAHTDIIKGAQLSLRYLRDADEKPRPDTSFFLIRNEWIYMCTSSLRRGDEVLITSSDGKNVIGLYPVAFVKDGDGREVTDATSGMYSFTGAGGGEAERVNSSAPIHHIEIKCELSEYRRILDFCAGKAGAPLMLVRKEAAS